MLFLFACERCVPGADEIRFLLLGFVIGTSIPCARVDEGPSLVLGLSLAPAPEACVNHDPCPCVCLFFPAAVLFAPLGPSLLIGREKFLDGLAGSSLTLDSLLPALLVPCTCMLPRSTLLPLFPGPVGGGLLTLCVGSRLALL